MQRTPLRALVLLAIGLALAGEIDAQDVFTPDRRFGVGLDYAGAISYTGQTTRGNFLGPAVGYELGTRGPLTLRADATLQFDAWADPFRNPNHPDGWRRPSTQDTRVLRALGIATLAVEAGTRDRTSIGGLFIAARAGGGLGRWGAGDVILDLSPDDEPVVYRDAGYAAVIATGGAEVGMWIPAFGRATRIAVRIDGVKARDFSTTRMAIVVLRH